MTGQESIKEVTGGSIAQSGAHDEKVSACEPGLSGPCAEGMTKHGDPLLRVGGGNGRRGSTGSGAEPEARVGLGRLQELVETGG
ncbi:MAG: hypothetical protein IH977_16050 [Nitrospinae bacterium]|nr:hypothetical protein [Nitrospinota bacterium]